MIYQGVITGHFYDQYGNYAEYRQIVWSYPDEYGVQELEIDKSHRRKYNYHYNENCFYKQEYWTIHFDSELNLSDSIMTYKLEIMEFIDPMTQDIFEQSQNKHLLFIVPKPVSGMVTVSITLEMK